MYLTFVWFFIHSTQILDFSSLLLSSHPHPFYSSAFALFHAHGDEFSRFDKGFTELKKKIAARQNANMRCESLFVCSGERNLIYFSFSIPFSLLCVTHIINNRSSSSLVSWWCCDMNEVSTPLIHACHFPSANFSIHNSSVYTLHAVNHPSRRGTQHTHRASLSSLLLHFSHWIRPW